MGPKPGNDEWWEGLVQPFNLPSNTVSASGLRPLGTRVVTYAGYADDIPACYDCETTRFAEDLKLWIKRRDYDPAIERLGLRTSRSYRGNAGWHSPRA